jgi:hypothetical protein
LQEQASEQGRFVLTGLELQSVLLRSGWQKVTSVSGGGTASSVLDQLQLLILQEQLTKNSSVIDLDWYAYLAKNRTSDLSREKMTEIILGMQNLIRTGNYQMLNSILQSMLVENSSPDTVVCLLRSTYIARANIKGWSKLAEKAKSWLNQRGFSADKLLLGI